MEAEAAAAAEEAAGARKRKRLGGEVGAGAEVAEEEVGGGGGGGVVGYEKKGLLLEGEEEEGCYDGIAEEAVAEVMRWLEAEISGAPAQPEEALGFVTINGNEDSCGPSFSCAASTVMASVDTRAGAPPPPSVPWPWPLPEAAANEEMGVAEAADDEEWLVELLTLEEV